MKTVETETFVPEIANAVPHLRITWDYAGKGLTVKDAKQRLREGAPSIEVRPSGNEALEIAVWMMDPGDEKAVGRRVREVLG